MSWRPTIASKRSRRWLKSWFPFMTFQSGRWKPSP